MGFAIGFTPTLIALEQLGLTPSAGASAAPAYVVAAGADLEREVFLLAEELRRAGVGAVFDTEGKSVKAQMKAAARGGHRLAVVLGPDELERGVVQLKDLDAAEQHEVARTSLAERAAALLAGPRT